MHIIRPNGRHRRPPLNNHYVFDRKTTRKRGRYTTKFAKKTKFQVRRIVCIGIGLTVVTALHGMQTRSSDKNSVCLSVRPSVCPTNAWIVTKQKTSPDFYTVRKNIYPSFLRKRMVGGATPSTWNFGSTDPRWSKIVDFEQIIARSASAVTPSQKVQLTLIGSPRRAFQWAYKMIIVRCP